MTIYKRKDSPYYWIRFSPIKGELKPFQQSTGTANKRQAQQLHDKLKAERWDVDNLDVKPRCRRRSNIDHLCRFNFDQGLMPAV